MTLANYLWMKTALPACLFLQKLIFRSSRRKPSLNVPSHGCCIAEGRAAGDRHGGP